MTDDRGFLSEAWSKWFRQIFLRTGGTDALSNTELENINVTGLQTQIDTANANIATLNTTVSGLTTSTQSALDGLRQGPGLWV